MSVLVLADHQHQEGVEASSSSEGHQPPNPLSRPGGTVLLPAAPGPGPYQQQATGGALELGLSQGYRQTFSGRNLLSPVPSISICNPPSKLLFFNATGQSAE